MVIHSSKGAAKHSGRGDTSIRQLLGDTESQFELGQVQNSQLLALLVGVAVLAVVYWRGGSTSLLLWFIPIWFLVVGLERLVVQRQFYRQPWLWVLNSWLSHWELLLASSTVISYSLYARHLDLTWGDSLGVTAKMAMAVFTLNSVALWAQWLGLAGGAVVQGILIAVDRTGCTRSWAWVELGGTTAMLLVVTLLLLYYQGCQSR